MNEENKPKRHYKVEPGDIFIVYRNDITKGDRTYTFYKIRIQKKKYDGTKETYYKNVAFKKDVELKDKTKIKIIDFFEDVFSRPNDKYNANWTLFITEFEEISNEEDKIMAIDEFNSLMDTSDVEISDEDIAF